VARNEIQVITCQKSWRVKTVNTISNINDLVLRSSSSKGGKSFSRYFAPLELSNRAALDATFLALPLVGQIGGHVS
jgi:hypothetical protein